MKKAFVFGMWMEIPDDQDVLDLADAFARAVWAQMHTGDSNMELNKEWAILWAESA